jgi:4-hydroxy-tetrahydrodipicolinate reductase
MINIVIAGYKGRMGGLIAKLVEEASDMSLAGGADIDAPLADVIDKADVVIDFTQAEAAAANAELAAETGKPIVIGTTGLNDKQRARVKAASERIPVMHAPNMSLGVNVLFHMINTAAGTLGDDFHIEISETHHINKVDRPSGTAVKMLSVAVEARGADPKKDVAMHNDALPQGTHPIEVCSFRKDDIIGEHTIRFVSPEETLEINHSAASRKLFARGAVTAARWLAGKPAGLYDMSDVLGLKGNK